MLRLAGSSILEYVYLRRHPKGRGTVTAHHGTRDGRATMQYRYRVVGALLEIRKGNSLNLDRIKVRHRISLG